MRRYLACDPVARVVADFDGWSLEDAAHYWRHRPGGPGAQLDAKIYPDSRVVEFVGPLGQLVWQLVEVAHDGQRYEVAPLDTEARLQAIAARDADRFAASMGAQ